MTTNIQDHLLTLAEWDELAEEVCRRSELVGGVLEVSPTPAVPHQLVMFGLALQLMPAARTVSFLPVQCVDVVVVPTFPPTLRSPDISVVPALVAASGPARFVAADVVLAVEIVSPGSGRRDRVTKMAEYARAGIPHLWVVTINGSAIELHTFELEGEPGAPRYRHVHHADGGTLSVVSPFEVTVDLDALHSW